MSIRPISSPHWLIELINRQMGASIGELLAASRQRLQGISRNPGLDAELLLAHTLNRGREYLYAHPEARVDDSKTAGFGTLLERRCAGEPVAYLTGWQEFWSLRLRVTPDVLIPRAETESVVELALSLTGSNKNLNVLDLGTGSGAIALAIASERPDFRVTATDLSPAALKIARYNAENASIANVEFYCGDWFDTVQSRKFDLIVSNPPYVAIDDPLLEQSVTRHEPHSAVISEDNGLQDIQRIIAAADRHLNPGGYLILEHGHAQANEVQQLLRQRTFTRIKTSKDLAQLDRCTSGCRENFNPVLAHR